MADLGIFFLRRFTSSTDTIIVSTYYKKYAVPFLLGHPV